MAKRAKTHHRLKNTNRKKTLQEMENSDWGEPKYNSYLVTTVHKLRRKPLEEFTTEDLRIMIGQNMGLYYLMPLAVAKLKEDPLAEGDYYPGDLLKVVLNAQISFWLVNPDLYKEVEVILDRAMTLINNSTEYDYEVTREALEQSAEVFKSLRMP